MTDTGIETIGNKRLSDLKRGYERDIEMEYALVGRAMGYPLKADLEQIAVIQSRIDEIERELTSRGIDPDDGYTITDDERYEANCRRYED